LTYRRLARNGMDARVKPGHDRIEKAPRRPHAPLR
jgi:hypothetical protein